MKTRVLTAAVLVPLLLVVVLVLPEIVTSVIVGVMAAIGAYELLFTTELVRHPRLNVYAMVMAFLVALWCHFDMPYSWGVLGLLVFLTVLFAEMMHDHVKITFEMLAITMVAGVLVPFLLSSIVRIHGTHMGRYMILAPFVMAFMSDSGAYFAGRAFGKIKLAPVISPKKTVEGMVGGILAAMASMVIYALVLQLACGLRVNYLYTLVYGLVGSLGAVFGDLCFSVIKRQSGVKDYGSIFPGHGGILDRFDSVIIVGPLAEVLLELIPFAEVVRG